MTVALLPPPPPASSSSSSSVGKGEGAILEVAERGVRGLEDDAVEPERERLEEESRREEVAVADRQLDGTCNPGSRIETTRSGMREGDKYEK